MSVAAVCDPPCGCCCAHNMIRPLTSPSTLTNTMLLLLLHFTGRHTRVHSHRTGFNYSVAAVCDSPCGCCCAHNMIRPLTFPSTLTNTMLLLLLHFTGRHTRVHSHRTGFNNSGVENTTENMCCSVVEFLLLYPSPPPPISLAVRGCGAGIPELVSLLHRRGVTVYLVSGGFRQVRAWLVCSVVPSSALGYWFAPLGTASARVHRRADGGQQQLCAFFCWYDSPFWLT